MTSNDNNSKRRAYLKLLPEQKDLEIIVKCILAIISSANLKKRYEGSIISKIFEQKELSTLNQQEEILCQSHVHEFEGSTKLAEESDDRHNHRFAGVTSQLIPDPDGHRHAILINTDFFENHHHEIGIISGIQIPVGNGKHVHFVGSPLGNATLDDGHFHQFQFATLIDSPLT